MLQFFSQQFESFEILWRLSRAHVTFYDMKTGHEVRQLHATSALDYARRAIKLNDNSAEAHKWYKVVCCVAYSYWA